MVEKTMPATDSPAPPQPPTAASNSIKKKAESSQQNGFTPSPKPKASIQKSLWHSLGITPTVIMFMVKGTVAPTIALSIYQSPAVAVNYLNFGFVMIVISITTVPILPRGQFIMNLFVSVFLTCFAAAMVLLGQFAGIKSRESTKPAGAPPDAYGTYNSSASAVNAIFLIINLFMINMLKAARPALYIPSIQFSIFIMIGFTYGPNQPTMHSSYNFVRELLYTFFTGQAISTGVSFLIIPVSSRKVFFAEATGLMRGFQGLLKAQLAFLGTLRHSELYAEVSTVEMGLQYQQKSTTLKSAFRGVFALSTKLHVDVVYAQRETAYGHFKGTDIEEFHQLLRGVIVPISGLSTIADISERLRNYEESEKKSARLDGTNDEKSTEPETLGNDQRHVRGDWQELVGSLHESFESTVQLLDDAITHVLILLQLIPVPKLESSMNRAGGANLENGTGIPDLESGLGNPRPGELGFGDYLEKEIMNLRPYRTTKLQEWAESKGLSSVVHKDANFGPNAVLEDPEDPLFARERKLRRQLNLVLYMEYLVYSVAITTMALVRFAEAKVEDQTLKRKRFVFPTYITIKIWIKSILFGDSSSESTENANHDSNEFEVIRVGDSLKSPHDPEHLPPKNAWQAFGDHIRVIPHFLGSKPAQFGARVTIATMSVGIIAFLEQTHVFFIKQRVVWALIMITIGMKPTNGSANFNLACNVIFSVGGMISAYINWYVVDGHTAGVIVIFALFMAFWFYWAARYPRFLIGIVAGALTQVLIIVRILGIPEATSTGQPYYPIYKLAPYRLLTVLAGSFIAYIWTIFPVPITEGSVLRQDVGRSLFLLAKYLSSVTATVDQRIHNEEGDMSIKRSPGRRLQEIRGKLLDEQVVLINSMQQNLVDMDWEPPFGGDFPKHTYSTIINEIQHIVQYLTVIAYSSDAFSRAHSSPSSWLSFLAASRDRSDHKSHKITSLLALLAASIGNNQALPPYLTAPKRERLSIARQVKAGMDGHGNDILDIRNVGELGFRSLGVIEVASACAIDGMSELLGLVKELVGEADYSFQIGKAKAS